MPAKPERFGKTAPDADLATIQQGHYDAQVGVGSATLAGGIVGVDNITRPQIANP